MDEYTCVYLFVCVFMCVRMYLRMSVCVCVCVCVCARCMNMILYELNDDFTNASGQIFKYVLPIRD